MTDHAPPPPSAGDSPLPPDVNGSVETLPASSAQTAEEALRARLAALDRLYESNAITLAELSEARNAILSGQVGERLVPIIGAEASSVVADSTVAAQTPSTAPEVGTSGPPGPPPPAMPPTEHIGPLPPPQPTRILGLPVWAAAAIAGALVVGAVLAVVFLVLGGSDSSKPAVSATSDYSSQVRAPLSLLTRSAVETGKALGRVSQPGDIAGLHKVASRQLDAVEKARTNVATIRVVPSARRAQAQLIRAAALQRRYLVQMGRATSGAPTQASLSAVNRTRRAAGEAILAYRTFFKLVPDAPDAITGTDLADTSGLSQAVKAGIASQGTSGRDGAAPVPPGIALTPLFIDPDSGDPSDFCFGPGQRPTAVASLTLSGSRSYSGIIQCGNSDAGPYAANGELRFDTSSLSGRITGVGGTFGIDETSTSQRGATATFTVLYGGQVLCVLTVSWGAPRSCPSLDGSVFANSGYLTIRQSVSPARSDRGLWAGVLNPTLILG
jgi:hypothetical protein